MKICYTTIMTRPRKWQESDLRNAVSSSLSIRQVLKKLKLVEAGGNYEQIKKYIVFYNISTSHFLGKGANKGRVMLRKSLYSLEEILKNGTRFQSFKLKNRLFKEGLKEAKCEKCDWAEMSADGRLPLELDHINGDRYDNRLENLRILCPNCHSLQLTHRGKNKKRG